MGLLYFYFYLLLFRRILQFVNHKIVIKKSVLNTYGRLQYLERLILYFKGLMADTSLIDLWLKKKKLCGFKLLKLFILVLFLFDGSFIFGKRPFYSFFYKFYEILLYLNKVSELGFKIIRQFYFIFLNLFFLFKNNKHNFRKKSVKIYPIRFGKKLLR